MSLRGIQMIDGDGAARTVQQLVASLYHFRPATLADAELMWQWRNDAEVRSVSFNKKLIPFEKHQTWLQNRLGDPLSTTWISEDTQGTPVAQIRFDFNAHDQTALISIIVDQARRSRGLGKLLIASACQQMLENSPAVRIIAQIKPSNAASEKAFRAAGFQAIEPTIVQGKMALQFVFERNGNGQPIQSAQRKTA
jgi:RimJ/RimL family protein N-acetyltransferase